MFFIFFLYCFFIFFFFFFFFNDTATTEIYTLSLHDALPICLPPLWTCSLPSFTLESSAAEAEPAPSTPSVNSTAVAVAMIFIVESSLACFSFPLQGSQWLCQQRESPHLG